MDRPRESHGLVTRPLAPSGKEDLTRDSIAAEIRKMQRGEMTAAATAPPNTV